MNTLSLPQAPVFETHRPAHPALGYGQKINDRFTVYEQLGRGGQAIVYGATDSETNSTAAIKVPIIEDEESEARFLKEVEVTRAMAAETDDTVGFLEAGISNGNDPFYYMAMEELSSESLAERIRTSKPDVLSVAEVIRITRPMLKAARRLHDANLVHRDLKAANTFINPRGIGKLGDYGLVGVESLEPELLELHHISPEVMAVDLTETNVWMGTPINMAPEFICGETGSTKANDVFAAGVTLDHALTGIHPILSKYGRSYKYKADTYDTPRESDYGRMAPKGLGALVVSMRERSPGNRATMREVVESEALYC